MNELTQKMLNSTATIKNAIPKIIEVFVAFYGEEERAVIEEKFRNLFIVGYCSPEHLKNALLRDEESKSNQLIDSFFSTLNIGGYDNEQLKKIIFDNVSLGWKACHNIYYYISYKNGEYSFKEKAVEFLKHFYSNVNTDNIDELIFTNTFEEIDKIVEKYLVMMNEFKKYQESIKKYKEYVDRCEELLESLNRKYTRNFLMAIKEHFNDNEWKKISGELDREFNTYSLKMACCKVSNFFSSNLQFPTLIDAFKEENDEILKSETEPEWKKQSIINDRINYFKNFGYDFGDNYDDYINNPMFMSVYPNKELVEQVLKIRDLCYTKMVNEYYTSIEEYKINRQALENEGFLIKDDYDAKAYAKDMTCISPNLKIVDNNYVSFPILIMSMGMSKDYLDKYLIHELNHIYELQFQKVQGNEYYGICGWDVIKEKIISESDNVPAIVDLNNEEEKREYELFNEIINEVLSCEITDLMHSLGIYIFNDARNAKSYGGVGYGKMKFLISEFYNTYKKEIITSRKSGNMNVLFEKVGKENFDALNDLFRIFNENIDGQEYRRVRDDLAAGIETEKTRIYNDLIAKRDEILAKMKEYSDTKVA